MATLEKDLDRDAQRVEEAISVGDVIGALYILLKMGGELAAWAGLFILSFKSFTLLAIIFPPAIFGHGVTIYLGRQLMEAVAYKYPQLPTHERRKVRILLRFINGLDAGDETDDVRETNEQIKRMDISSYGNIEAFSATVKRD